jgi:uroporphyrinogen-III synthase
VTTLEPSPVGVLGDDATVPARDPEGNLDGFVVGVTADRRWGEQAELFEQRGATVVHGATIHTRPLRSEGVRDVTERLLADPPDIVIANTGIGMRAWFATVDSCGMAEPFLRMLAGTRIYARGPKAAAVVHQMGLTPSGSSPSEQLDDLPAIVAADGPVAGERVVFQRHGVASPSVIEALRGMGAVVEDLGVYDWTLPEDLRPAQRLVELLAARRLHGVTFTSGPAVRNLLAIAADLGIAGEVVAALDHVVAACVGPVCASALLDAGVRRVVVPEHHRLGALVRTTAHALAATELTLRIGRSTVVVRGTVVERDGDRFVLADREAAVLGVLARSPGRVVSKEALLHHVWGPTAGDLHVVHVTVARLRRRLGDLGDRVGVVPRRGYLLDAR